MSAGLPGLGLGGIFFVVSALLAPLLELVRMARGTSSAERRRQIGRQFAMALAMIVAVDLTLRAVLLVAAAAGIGSPAAADGLLVLPLTPLGITGAILAGLLLIAKGTEVALSVRRPVRRAIFRGRVLVTLAATGGRGSGGS
jgi:hypothetical protein